MFSPPTDLLHRATPATLCSPPSDCFHLLLLPGAEMISPQRQSLSIYCMQLQQLFKQGPSRCLNKMKLISLQFLMLPNLLSTDVSPISPGPIILQFQKPLTQHKWTILAYFEGLVLVPLPQQQQSCSALASLREAVHILVFVHAVWLTAGILHCLFSVPPQTVALLNSMSPRESTLSMGSPPSYYSTSQKPTELWNKQVSTRGLSPHPRSGVP